MDTTPHRIVMDSTSISLFSKSFLIFTGISGSGKTNQALKIAKKYCPQDSKINLDPFTENTLVPSAKVSYLVAKSDATSIELWNNRIEAEAIKVTLPREMIREWASYIEANSLSEKTLARDIREVVKKSSQFSDQLHSFETHLKCLAFHQLKHEGACDERKSSSPPGYAVIPVGSDWNNRDALLGYPDGLSSNRYVSTTTLNLISAATNNPDLPYFLILDEMNLSHVERYFADFLSAMESGEPIPLYEGETRYAELDNAGVGVTGTEIPLKLSLPNNLFVIGTVNVDETTYQFSPKVLDRANVIEFSMEPKNVGAFFSHSNDDAIEYCGDEEAKQFVLAANTKDLVAIDFAKKHSRFSLEMQTLFELLQEFNAEFGYRTLKEASRYLYFSISNSPDDDDKAYLDAMDAIIIQKLLPKLHGSRPKLERQLRALHYFCSKVNTSGDLDLLKADSLKAAQDTSPLGELSADGTYVRSAKKLAKMCKKLERDQFVSFAEA